MATDAPVQIPRQRISELIEREEKQLNERTQRSKEMYERAQVHLSGGVASSYQLRDPWPIYLERGSGPRVWDVDGNEMWDFHNGFGSMVQGHAHPAIGAAIAGALRRRGTHFAAPTEDAIVVGDELARRWGLPKWRYTNSGSESTMDAIRIARDAHRPRHRREDLRLLPRPPRHGDGLDRHPVRQHRGPRQPRVAALRRRHPAGHGRGHDDPGAVQRHRRDGAADRAPHLREEPQASLHR